MRATRAFATRRSRVCLITRDYLSATPRVVKEADALYDAGFDVRIVFSQGGIQSKRVHDSELLIGKPWRWTAVRFAPNRREGLLWLWTAARQRAWSKMPKSSWSWSHAAECADGRMFPELARAAAAEHADLYIGHYTPGLAAAAHAARVHQTLFGFDAEDFHTGEGNDPAETERVDFIQNRYLPHCAHITASSAGISDALRSRYGIGNPLTIHNVFPWADRLTIDGKLCDRRGPAFSVYWYSQTIGGDRGIQDAIRAVGLLRGPVQLHLRGTISDKVRQDLLALARKCGVAESLYIHPQVSPSELLARAAEHDVGLALEQGCTPNRAICATNKMFLYMLAGLAIASTDVPGQAQVLSHLRSGAALYRPGDYVTLAAHLENWRVSQERLREAKTNALEAARTRWNWEMESKQLVEAVRYALQRATQGIPDHVPTMNANGLAWQTSSERQ